SSEEMLKPNCRAPCRDHFGLLLQILILIAKIDSSLDFVRKAKKIIDRKKMSLEKRFVGFADASFGSMRIKVIGAKGYVDSDTLAKHPSTTILIGDK
ncbi:hypothetical protein KI387_025978, partial [Taxus chinensis]